MKIAVMTDTHGGILQEEAKENGIHLLAAPFIVDGAQYKEGVNLSSDEFYEKMRNGASVSTSQPSPGEILDMWDSLLKEYDEIVCVNLSSSLTGAYDTMVMLASEEPYIGRVFVVDNRGVSVVERQSVYDAKRMAELGYSGSEIKDILEKNRENNLIYITVTTLEYLKRGGRITPAAAAIGSLLKLKPVLEIDGGKLDAFAKVRTLSQAKETMLSAIEAALSGRLQDPEAEDSYIMVAHTQNEAGAEELLNAAKERWPKAEFYMAPLPLAIACHVGPGAFAIVAERKLKEVRTPKN